MQYSAKQIISIRDQLEAWEKPEKIMKIWKRPLLCCINYDESAILDVNNEDLSWVLPLKIAEIHKRSIIYK